MSKYKRLFVEGLVDPVNGSLVGFMGGDGQEYLFPTSTVPTPTRLIVNNGAAITYTVPVGYKYVYLKTTALVLTITFPVAIASMDGMTLTVVPSAAVLTVNIVAPGATIIAGATALAVNTPMRYVYDHASLTWYPT